MIQHGESVKTGQARLGHASAVETLDTYGQCAPIPPTERRTRLIRCSDLLQTHCGPRRLRVAECAVQRVCWDELACKPDSVPYRRGVSNGGKAATIHLDTPLPGASSGLPAGIGRATLERLRGRTCRCDLLDLASGGVCLAIPVTRNAGALLPHRFTLTTARVAVCFLWHFPASHLGLPLAITLLCEVRTFLDSTPDLSNRCEPRPPSQLVRDEHGTRCGLPRPVAARLPDRTC
jgi:hypothetical protein